MKICTNGFIDEIHSVYIHTLHKILLCAPLRTKNPKPHGKKEESVKHNYYSKVKMLKCYIMRINTLPIKNITLET